MYNWKQIKTISLTKLKQIKGVQKQYFFMMKL